MKPAKDSLREEFAKQGIDSKKFWSEQVKYDWIWLKHLPDVPNREKRLQELRDKGLMPEGE